MKHRVKNPDYTEIEIADGYYREDYDYYCISGGNALKVMTLGNYASINTSINEYDSLEEATPITKDEFEAELEIAFEIIRSKLNNTCPQCSGTGEVDELDKSKVNSQTITPPYHKVKCETCDGGGKSIKEG